MFAIHFDCPAEAPEVAASRTEKLMHTEGNRGARRIKLIALLRRSDGSQSSDCNRSNHTEQTHPRKSDCHVERSETSLAIPIWKRRSKINQRFFASLRMTVGDRL